LDGAKKVIHPKHLVQNCRARLARGAPGGEDFPGAFGKIASETRNPKFAHAKNYGLKQVAQWRGMPNEGPVDKLSTRILLAVTNPRGAYFLPYNE
jgi:hypothetical protein